jgi:hypothetical protein
MQKVIKEERHGGGSGMTSCNNHSKRFLPDLSDIKRFSSYWIFRLD